MVSDRHRAWRFFGLHPGPNLALSCFHRNKMRELPRGEDQGLRSGALSQEGHRRGVSGLSSSARAQINPGVHAPVQLLPHRAHRLTKPATDRIRKLHAMPRERCSPLPSGCCVSGTTSGVPAASTRRPRPRDDRSEPHGSSQTDTGTGWSGAVALQRLPPHRGGCISDVAVHFRFAFNFSS